MTQQTVIWDLFQLMTRRLYVFFSSRNFSGHSWCSYFDMTDGYLRFIPTVGQMTVPFFLVVIFPVVIWSAKEPTINISGQTTVPFFPVVIFSNRNWCLYFDTKDGWLSVIWDGHMVVGDLRFIPTEGQTTVPFFSCCNFSGRNFFEAAQNTKHNTHRHNNQQDEPATLPSSGFAPSLFISLSVCPSVWAKRGM